MSPTQSFSALVPTRRQIQDLLGHKHLGSIWHCTRVTAHELRGAVAESVFH